MNAELFVGKNVCVYAIPFWAKRALISLKCMDLNHSTKILTAIIYETFVFSYSAVSLIPAPAIIDENN